MAAIIWSIATIILSFVIRKSNLGQSAAYLGFVAGILDLIGAFPWLTGTAVVFVSQLAFAAWFVVLGVRLVRNGEQGNLLQKG